MNRFYYMFLSRYPEKIGTCSYWPGGQPNYPRSCSTSHPIGHQGNSHISRARASHGDNSSVDIAFCLFLPARRTKLFYRSSVSRGVQSSNLGVVRLSIAWAMSGFLGAFSGSSFSPSSSYQLSPLLNLPPPHTSCYIFTTSVYTNYAGWWEWEKRTRTMISSIGLRAWANIV